MSIRSSLPVVFCKTGVLRNLAKSPGKHLCQSLFFKKRGSGTVVFSFEFGEIKNIFIYRTPPEDCFWTILLVLTRAYYVSRFQGSWKWWVKEIAKNRSTYSAYRTIFQNCNMVGRIFSKFFKKNLTFLFSMDWHWNLLASTITKQYKTFSVSI